MRVSTFAVLASTIFGFASAQKFQQVEVGTPDGQLKFNPETVSDFTAGDVIQFIFYPKAHSVTQSTFGAPCTYNNTGVNTGLQKYDTPNPPMLKSWNFTLPANASADKPLWFFCANPGHCEKGMVFSINPDKGKTPAGAATSHQAYVANALKVQNPAANGTAAGNTTASASGSGAAGATGTAGASGAAGASGTNTAAAGASSGTGAPAGTSPNGAASIARNSAGAVAALGLALGLLL